MAGAVVPQSGGLIMAGTFIPRTDALLAQVGDGPLEMHLHVDQVYARYQHEGLEFAHPRGGMAKYLEVPFFAHAGGHLSALADGTLDNLRGAAVRVAEAMDDDMHDNAPVEFDQLRRSGHPTVTDNGAVVYDRPPDVPRLSEAALRAKSRARGGHPYGYRGRS